MSRIENNGTTPTITKTFILSAEAITQLLSTNPELCFSLALCCKYDKGQTRAADNINWNAKLECNWRSKFCQSLARLNRCRFYGWVTREGSASSGPELLYPHQSGRGEIITGNNCDACLHLEEALTYRNSRICFGKGQTLWNYWAVEWFCRFDSH